ncbi:hypothetical protein BSL78_00958 [Apostichopus japonicus]|uniref:Uncharacterized protein n=1 Tax=Stichopus japonicus TaxID=307972 RepID=A0A2G8LPA6_STIJA|nr:hypothetical protein BSL78_00958 [Apostichopus japonicus]
MHLCQVFLLIAVVVCSLNTVTCRSLRRGPSGHFPRNNGRNRRIRPKVTTTTTTTSRATAVADITNVVMPSPSALTTLCPVSETESTDSASQCAQTTADEFRLVQNVATHVDDALEPLNQRALCRWRYARNNKNNARIPVELPEVTCESRRYNGTYSCREVWSKTLVLYRGDCINGTYTYTVGVEEYATACVPTEVSTQ